MVENFNIHLLSYSTTISFHILLLNSFYGGALTMFFSSGLSIPFENIREAIHTYPHWKVMFQKGRRKCIYKNTLKKGYITPLNIFLKHKYNL